MKITKNKRKMFKKTLNTTENLVCTNLKQVVQVYFVCTKASTEVSSTYL